MKLTGERRELGRRNFLKAVAATPVAGALIWKASSMTPVKVGIIGVGGQGSVLLENAPPSHIRVSAVCDIYPENLERALKFAREQHDPEAEAYEDYKELLARRDLEAVIIATPLWMHAPMTIDALDARKHVFCEKNMALGIDDCRQMVEASRRNRRNLQIGHQRAYNPLYHEAKKLIDTGAIGDMYHIRALWHRNNTWRRDLPDGFFDPSAWGYEDKEQWINWRLYKKFSLGLMAELASHQIQIVNWFTGSLPTRVYGTGGICKEKDGREIPDHVYLMYEYPDDRTLTYSSIQSNSWDHYYEAFFGTDGTIVLSGEQEAMLFYEGEGPEATELKVEDVHAGMPLMQASGSTSGINALSAYMLELEGFAQTIRAGRPNQCPGTVGMNAAVASIMGYDAVNKRVLADIREDLYSRS